MLKDLSAIPLRPHPELTILLSQPSPPVVRARRDGSPQVTSPPSPYNFEPPMPGSRSPYSVRRTPVTPGQPKTPKTPKTPQSPHTTPSRRSMARRSFGTLARRLSSLTTRHASPSVPDTPPPMPPPYKGPPLFPLSAEPGHSAEPLILGSYPQFSPSSFFRGFEALRNDGTNDDGAFSSDTYDNTDVFMRTKGLGILPFRLPQDTVPIRTDPSTSSLASPPPKVGLPPSPPPLFPRVSLFDGDVVEIVPENDGVFPDDRRSFDLGPLLFDSSLSPESYNSAIMFHAGLDASSQTSRSPDLAGLRPSQSYALPSQ